MIELTRRKQKFVITNRAVPLSIPEFRRLHHWPSALVDFAPTEANDSPVYWIYLVIGNCTKMLNVP